MGNSYRLSYLKGEKMKLIERLDGINDEITLLEEEIKDEGKRAYKIVPYGFKIFASEAERHCIAKEKKTGIAKLRDNITKMYDRQYFTKEEAEEIMSKIGFYILKVR